MMVPKDTFSPPTLLDFARQMQEQEPHALTAQAVASAWGKPGFSEKDAHRIAWSSLAQQAPAAPRPLTGTFGYTNL